MNGRLNAVCVMLVQCLYDHLHRLLALFVGLALEVKRVVLSADLALNIS